MATSASQRTTAMKFKAGQFVVVKHLGAAKVDDVIDGAYFLFFANGKRGGGWKDHDIERVLTEKEFWSEWRRFKAFN